jgi:uncharacterized protein YegP (UPF0339 family)
MTASNVIQLEIFQGEDEQWYWRGQAENGEVVAMSEGYTRKDDAREAGHKTFPDVGAIIINEN